MVFSRSIQALEQRRHPLLDWQSKLPTLTLHGKAALRPPFSVEPTSSSAASCAKRTMRKIYGEGSPLLRPAPPRGVDSAAQKLFIVLCRRRGCAFRLITGWLCIVGAHLPRAILCRRRQLAGRARPAAGAARSATQPAALLSAMPGIRWQNRPVSVQVQCCYPCGTLSAAGVRKVRWRPQPAAGLHAGDSV